MVFRYDSYEQHQPILGINDYIRRAIDGNSNSVNQNLYALTSDNKKFLQSIGLTLVTNRKNKTKKK